MHRTLTTRHVVAPDIEWRVSLHQPVKSEVGSAKLIPNGDPWIVIEVYHRQDNGDWKLIGSMRDGAFEETVEDIRDLSKFLITQHDKREQRKAVEGAVEAAEHDFPVDDQEPKKMAQGGAVRGRRVLIADDAP